mgnify:CR=1 FL=1
MDSDFAVGDLKDIRGAVGDCKSMICRPSSPRTPESYESGRSYLTGRSGRSDGLRFRGGRLERHPRCGGRLQVYDLSPFFSARVAESYESGRSYYRPNFLSDDQVDTAAPRKYAAGVDERKEREDREISVGERMRGGGMKKGEGKGLKWREGKRKGGGMGKEGEGYGVGTRKEAREECSRREGGW